MDASGPKRRGRGRPRKRQSLPRKRVGSPESVMNGVKQRRCLSPPHVSGGEPSQPTREGEELHLFRESHRHRVDEEGQRRSYRKDQQQHMDGK